MRTYQYTTALGLENLQIVDKPILEPGPGQALIKMHAWSLNYRDLLVAKGAYGRTVAAPLVPLSDGAGEVVAVGSGAGEFRPGDRVMPIFMQNWLEGDVDDSKAASALGGAIDGVLSEYVCLAASGLVGIPQHLSYEQAATLPCAAVTAWNVLFRSGQLRPGETVLLQGTGGVSMFALQFAKMAGARVILTSSADEKRERARQFGADETINYRWTPQWDQPVREMTGGTGVDHVVEVGGAGTLGLSLKAVRRYGHIGLVGVLAGGGEIDPRPILMKSVRLHGVYVGSREMFGEMNRAITVNKLAPVLDRVFPFEEAKSAMDYMTKGLHLGKVGIRL